MDDETRRAISRQRAKDYLAKANFLDGDDDPAFDINDYKSEHEKQIEAFDRDFLKDLGIQPI